MAQPAGKHRIDLRNRIPNVRIMTSATTVRLAPSVTQRTQDERWKQRHLESRSQAHAEA
jgi:hypothetical protein